MKFTECEDTELLKGCVDKLWLIISDGYDLFIETKQTKAG